MNTRGPYDISAIPPDEARAIEIYEIQLGRVQAGQVEETLFTEFRLRHGVYGQRDDRSQMIRVKIPFGGLTAVQLEMLADVAEEFSDNIIHITTRQDVQYHYVDINNTPELMRRLASVDITTKEACGNVVRNVTACPLSGVCQDETFDVTPYSKALSAFLLGHPDAQDFGRKFKIAFSGCEEHACGLANMHDIGCGWLLLKRWMVKLNVALDSTSVVDSAQYHIKRRFSTISFRQRNSSRFHSQFAESSPG